MKKFTACCLLLVVFAAGIAATLGYLAWRQRARAETGGLSEIEVAAAIETREEVTRKIEDAASGGEGSRVVLDESDLQALMTSALAEHPRSRDFIEVARDIRADVEEGSAEWLAGKA